MTQQPLPLDQFSHVRIVVDFDAQQKAYRALEEIHVKAEFARRSLGQKVRFAMERIGR